MSKKQSTKLTKVPAGYAYKQTVAGVSEYILKNNGLRVFHVHRPGTNVVTTNITYLVGARDEVTGETGLAHMLEHMLFKPTKADVAAKRESAAMRFEKEVGCVLNANTWRDRTTYYFSYPAEYLERALSIEAERMEGVILTEKELSPEKMNVLSEFDMYNGDPGFALSVQMCRAAFLSHPYGHETIGFREDIEAYTAEKLERFYRNYYRPDNAVMMVIGDVDANTALSAVKKYFGGIQKPTHTIPRIVVSEPKQEGQRRTTITRPSTQNVLAIGFKHPGFPTKEWFETAVMIDVLTGGEESILHKLLVDTGKASGVSGLAEPSRDTNLGIVSVDLAASSNHNDIEALVYKAINELTLKDISLLVKKSKVQMITHELFSRESSLNIARELTEYVASGTWEAYDKTVELLEGITAKHVLDRIRTSFQTDTLIIGQFIGSKRSSA